MKVVRKPPPEAVRHHDWLSWAGTMPQMLHLPKGAGKRLKCEQGFSLEITTTTVQDGDCPDEKGNTAYSLFVCTGIHLGSTWKPSNIVGIGWLTWKRLSRAVFCSKKWPRAETPVLSLSLPVPQKTTACLHPVPLNMANKALWRVLWLESQQVDVILTPILWLGYRTGLQIGISPH